MPACPATPLRRVWRGSIGRCRTAPTPSSSSLAPTTCCAASIRSVTRDGAGHDSAPAAGAPYRRSHLRHARGAESRRRLWPGVRKHLIPRLPPNTASRSIPFFLDGVAGNLGLIAARRPASRRRRGRRDRRAHLAEGRGTIARFASQPSVVRVACVRAIPACCAAAIRRDCRPRAAGVMPRLFTGLEIPLARRPVAGDDARRLAGRALDRSGKLSHHAALHRRYRRRAGARHRRPARPRRARAVRIAHRRARVVRRPQAARAGRGRRASARR